MCHVLVIEDDWLTADYVGTIATDAGATSIATAHTQEEAIAFALELRPEVILSDVHLSAGTGPLAAQAIRRRHGPVPVIFITASPDACEPCDYASAILTKPLCAAALTEAFRKVAPHPAR